MTTKRSLRGLVKNLFGINLYWYQQRFLYDCLNEKRVVGAFCRQTGKSMTISILAILEGLRTPNGHIVIVAPTDRQAGELFKKVSDFIKGSPVAQHVASFTQRQLTLNNGCRIAAYPCGDTGDNIRGLTANVLIIEEAAFVKDSIVKQVLIPMVAATKGKIIKISTPFGMNHFYRSFQEDDNYVSHRYTWVDAVNVGHFTQEFIEEQKLQCSRLEFQTEYEAQFIPDEDAYFPYALVDNCTRDYELFSELDRPSGLKGYYLGVDFARMGQDSSVFLVVEKGDPNKVVFIKELKKNTMDEAIDYIKYLHSIYKFRKIICDQTGLGAGAVDVLARDLNMSGGTTSQNKYNIKYEEADIVVGVTFTLNTKQDIFSNLKLMMEQGELIFPSHKRLVFELKDFRYEISASGNLKLHHSEGGHDDFVDALACASHALRQTEHAFCFL